MNGLIQVRHPETGAQEFVRDLAAYEGWEVLESGLAHPRGDCRREGGRWRVDRESHRRAALARTPNEELVTRLAALEAKMASSEEA